MSVTVFVGYMPSKLSTAREQFDKQSPRSMGSVGRDSVKRTREEKFFLGSPEGEPWRDYATGIQTLRNMDAKQSVRKWDKNSEPLVSPGSTGRESAYKKMNKKRGAAETDVLVGQIKAMFGQ